jgi:hypothetical protein
MHGIMPFRAEVRRVVVAELLRLLGREVFLLRGLEVLFHLPHDMFGLVMVLDVEIGRCFSHLVRMPAHRAEFPFLVAVHVHKCPASRAADDKVHGNEVIDAIIIKTYRRPGAGDSTNSGNTICRSQ